ncbi:MAG TPA: ABC transporter substrate-binding protein [Burkholderiaceae bacterium]|nr:ABC transporter substrate-binding protein [Burkholderiaceae bacterium]
MRRVLSILWTTAALAVAPLAVAQQQGVTSDTVTIGAFGPITGPAAYIGLAGRDGMNLAIKEINAAGGIHGRKIVAVFEDDAHSPTRALAAVKKLIEQDRVFAVMSVGGSNATVGAVDYVKEKGNVMYVSIASAPPVTWPFARNMFRGGTTETARYGELYAEYLATNAKRIAIMHGREEYPRNEGEATIAKLKSWFDMAPVARVEFNINDKDFTPQLIEVQKANPDVIAFFGNPAEAAIAMRQARELGIKQPFFVGSNMVDPSLVTAARTSAEGVTGFSLIPYLPGSSAAEMKTWEANWRKEYPSAPAGRPNNFDLLAYGDMHVLAEGLRRAGKNLTTESLIKGLESIKDYRVGPVATPRTFASNHHIGNLTLVPMTVKGGQWEPVPWQSKRESDILTRYK